MKVLLSHASLFQSIIMNSKSTANQHVSAYMPLSFRESNFHSDDDWVDDSPATGSPLVQAPSERFVYRSGFFGRNQGK